MLTSTEVAGNPGACGSTEALPRGGDSRALSEATPCQSPAPTLEVQFDLEAAVRLKGTDVKAELPGFACWLTSWVTGEIMCPHHISVFSHVKCGRYWPRASVFFPTSRVSQVLEAYCSALPLREGLRDFPGGPVAKTLRS